MAYLLDLFTPETWQAFRQANASVTGFRERHGHLAKERVSQGDIFLCYVTRLSRWCGVLKAQSDVYYDDSPIFGNPDPFTVRFRVEPIVILDSESAIPIYDTKVWNSLTITNQYERGSSQWTGFFRGSLNRFNDSDGSYLVELLKEQQANPRSFPFTEKDKRQLASRQKIRTLNREVEVEIPEDIEGNCA